jgi:lysophospholipase L1-like esterase
MTTLAVDNLRWLTRYSVYLAVAVALALAPLGADTEKPQTTPIPSAVLDKDFARWKATLPSDQQVWENFLLQNLGKPNRLTYERQKLDGQPTEFDYVRDDPNLPRVLLIGDSISCGYTLPVRRALAGIANVHRAPDNCASTAHGVAKIDVWLAGEKWDVIHFNFGMHDRTTPIAEYRERLEQITTRLKASGAKLVWATTTPAPPDTKEGPALPGMICARNEVAAEIMKRHDVAVDDLFTAISPTVRETRNPQDMHFNSDGYELLARQVAGSIKTALEVR